MGKVGATILAIALSVAMSTAALAGSAREGIEASLAKFAEAFNKGDAAGVAALYTEDGAVLPPDATRVDGRAAIQAFWQGAIDAGLKDLTLKVREVSDNGNSAQEVGGFALKAPDGNGGYATVTGKYLVYWKKESDGTWRLHRDVYNMNPPAQ